MKTINTRLALSAKPARTISNRAFASQGGKKQKISLKFTDAEVAQLVEHSPEERGVTSSSLVLGTIIKIRPMADFYYGAEEQI